MAETGTTNAGVGEGITSIRPHYPPKRLMKDQSEWFPSGHFFISVDYRGYLACAGQSAGEWDPSPDDRPSFFSDNVNNPVEPRRCGL